MIGKNWPARRPNKAEQKSSASKRMKLKGTRSRRVIYINGYKAFAVILVATLMATLRVQQTNKDNIFGAVFAHQNNNDHLSQATSNNQQQASQTQPTSTSLSPLKSNQFHQIPIESIKNVTFIEVKAATSTPTPSTAFTLATPAIAPKSTPSSASSSHQLAGRSAALLVSSLPPPPLSSSARAFLEDALATSASTLSNTISTVSATLPPSKLPVTNKQRLGSQSTSSSLSKSTTTPSSTPITTSKPVKHVKKALAQQNDASTSGAKLLKTEAKLPTKINSQATAPKLNKRPLSSQATLAPSIGTTKDSSELEAQMSSNQHSSIRTITKQLNSKQQTTLIRNEKKNSEDNNAARTTATSTTSPRAHILAQTATTSSLLGNMVSSLSLFSQNTSSISVFDPIQNHLEFLFCIAIGPSI